MAFSRSQHAPRLLAYLFRFGDAVLQGAAFARQSSVFFPEDGRLGPQQLHLFLHEEKKIRVSSVTPCISRAGPHRV